MFVEEDDGPLPSTAIADRDCSGTSALLPGLGVSILFASEYTEVEGYSTNVFLDVRSPSGAIVHNSLPVCDTRTSKFCVGGMF